MDITTNEYIHEHMRRSHRLGVEIIYEPVDNLTVISLEGSVYIDGEECHPFFGYGVELAIHEDLLNVWPDRPKPIKGRLDRITGVLSLVWDKPPGDHFLCVSYNFDDEEFFEEDDLDFEVEERINWALEGF